MSKSISPMDGFCSPIRSICLSSNEQYMFVGLESGELRILSQDPSYLRPKLRMALKVLGFLGESTQDRRNETR